MTIEINSNQEELIKQDELFAHDEKGNIYDVYDTKETFNYGMCIGKIRCIIKSGEIVYTIFPLMSTYIYRILSKKELLNKISLYKKILSNYENR